MNDQNLKLRAERVLPAGGLGNFPPDFFVREGKGARVTDTNGNEYVDFLIGSGPMLIGHCIPAVMDAVNEQLKKGTTFFANNEPCVALAEAIVDATPCAEQVRFVSSGTEATMYAMRLARAHRKRDKLLKFEGGYHGMHDYALQSLAPTRLVNFPQAVADSPGIPKRVGEEMIVAPYNDVEGAIGLIREHADELAGIIVEPMQRLLPPVPGFLAALREVTTELGLVLIFDEVVTGFRMSYASAQGYYGVTPDICSMGKVIGGGFPLAAIAGRREIMAHFDAQAVAPEDFTIHIGTLSGNPVASVAGLATLEILRAPGTYERLFEIGNTLMQGLRSALDEFGVVGQVVGEPPMFDVVFTSRPVRNYRDMAAGDRAMHARFNAALREQGILKGAPKFYVCAALKDDDIDQTLHAFRVAAKAVAG
jgi:glutamate-1-semialdehyde 2,1-aminomutase